MPNSFAEVIELWPSSRAMSEEIDADASTIRHWKMRDSIPAEYWVRVITAARKRGAKVDAADFAEFAARKLEAA
jgi:hypothetical protein